MDGLRRRVEINGNGFLFSTNGRAKPITSYWFNKFLAQALAEIGIDEEEQKRWNRSAHLWQYLRKFFPLSFPYREFNSSRIFRRNRNRSGDGCSSYRDSKAALCGGIRRIGQHSGDMYRYLFAAYFESGNKHIPGTGWQTEPTHRFTSR